MFTTIVRHDRADFSALTQGQGVGEEGPLFPKVGVGTQPFLHNTEYVTIKFDKCNL